MRRTRLLADLTPLRRFPQFRLLWGGYLVSMLGSQLTVVAVPYQVYRMTHSSLDVGLASLTQLVPLLIGSLVGGSLSDAYDRRKILLCTQSLMALTSVGLALNGSSRHPALWPLFVLTAASAAFSGADSPTRQAAQAMLVDRASFTAAAALWQMVMQTSQLVGPAAAGLLLARFGLAPVYWVDVASFAVSLVAVVALRPLPPDAGGTRFGLRSIAEGVTYLKGKPALQGNFIIDLDAMIFGMPRALFPALGIVRFHGGARTVGLLYAAPGAGALIGALFTGWVASVRRQGRAVLLAVTVWGLAITAFGFSPWLVPALAVMALAGAADVVSAVFRNTILQLAVPDSLRGRLSAIHIAVVTGGPRLGDAESGAAAALIGTEAAVVSGGLACLVGVGAIALAMPAFRRYQALTIPGQFGDGPPDDGEAAPPDDEPPDDADRASG